MNTKRAGLAALTIFMASLFGGQAWAHHGGAAYDRATTLTLKAKVTEFRFINPHVQIYFDATDDKGQTNHWAGEFPWDPGMLSRYGWDRNTIKAGDMVTVIGHPAKSGSPIMSVSKVILANGQEMSTSPPAQ